MKCLKSTANNNLAIVTETTVYITDFEGKIIRFFPVAHFKNKDNYSETVNYPSDFEREKRAYYDKIEQARREREQRETARRQVELEKSKREALNIWRWQKKEVDAFLVRTSMQDAEPNRNSDPEQVNNYLFFNEEEARDFLASTSESEIPEYNNNTNRCYFVCELKGLVERPSYSRLNSTSIDDIIDDIISNGYDIDTSCYAPSIDDKDVVVRITSRGGINIEERLTFRYGHCWAQETTADLLENEEALTYEELAKKYPEQAISQGFEDKIKEYL